MNKIIIVNWSLVLLIKLHNMNWIVLNMKYYLVCSIRSIWHSFVSPIFHIEAHMLLCRILHNHPSCLYMACLYVYHVKKIFKIYSISLSVIKKSFRSGSLKHLHFISKLCNRFKQSRSHFFYLYNSCTLIPWYTQVNICILDKCQD